MFRVFWWAALGGLIGGRLYFVLQQPDLVQHYLEQPLHILAVWNGGMAFFGAIFLGLATVAVVSWRQHVPIWLAFDVAAVFAVVGQIFGRVGNLINGDILGYQAGTLATRPSLCAQEPCLGFIADPHIVPWAMVYANPYAFAPLYTPFQPAAAYEMVMNLALLTGLHSPGGCLARRIPIKESRRFYAPSNGRSWNAPVWWLSRYPRIAATLSAGCRPTRHCSSWR